MIGRRVVELWNLDLEPVAFGGRPTQDLLAPGTLADEIHRVRPEVVLHLAWSSGSDPAYRHSPDNDRWVSVSLEAADACVRTGSHLLAIGTVLDDRGPLDAYAEAKQRLRTALEGFDDSLNLTWLRPFYVFDPAGGRPGVLAAAREAAEGGRSTGLRAPHARHDFVHVDDVARAVTTAISAGLRGPVDIGSGRTHTVAQLVQGVGSPWHDEGKDDPRDHDERVAQTSLLRAAGWEPRETERFFADD